MPLPLFQVQPRNREKCPKSNKIGYSNVPDANLAVLYAWRHHGAEAKPTLHPYTCPHCGYLHLSSCKPGDNDVKNPVRETPGK